MGLIIACEDLGKLLILHFFTKGRVRGRFIIFNTSRHRNTVFIYNTETILNTVKHIQSVGVVLKFTFPFNKIQFSLNKGRSLIYN